MIIKGKSRGRAAELARHLLRTDHNEAVRLFECRGTVARDVTGALLEMEALGLASRSARPLYHASISPAKHLPLTDAQVRIAVGMLERKLGLSGQPRVTVLHRKGSRDHVHVVWSRIDASLGRAIPDGWNYRHHEAVARELEAAFGHPTVPGGSAQARARRAPKEYEYRQAERSGAKPTTIADELKALWERAADGKVFREMLAAAGYTLARGDRRVFVVIDRAGNVHSLSRRLGMRGDQLRARLDGIRLEALPGVAEVRTAGRRETRQEVQRLAYRAGAACTGAQAFGLPCPARDHRGGVRRQDRGGVPACARRCA